MTYFLWGGIVAAALLVVGLAYLFIKRPDVVDRAQEIAGDFDKKRE